MIQLTDKELCWEFMRYLKQFYDKGTISRKECDNLSLLGLYHNKCCDWSSPSIQDALQEIISANHSAGTLNDS